jgi:hypothetical protein
LLGQNKKKLELLLQSLGRSSLDCVQMSTRHTPLGYKAHNPMAAQASQVQSILNIYQRKTVASSSVKSVSLHRAAHRACRQERNRFQLPIDSPAIALETLTRTPNCESPHMLYAKSNGSTSHNNKHTKTNTSHPLRDWLITIDPLGFACPEIEDIDPS